MKQGFHRLAAGPLVCVSIGLSLILLGNLAAAAPHLATGVKVGEVTDTSAVVWARVTASPTRNAGGVRITGRVVGKPKEVPVLVAQLEGACPGMAGKIRVRYGVKEGMSGARTTEWRSVSAETDFAHSFRIDRLTPNSTVYYVVETASPDGTPGDSLTGQFQTAPPPDEPAAVTFCVITGQAYYHLDHADGFHIYPAMQRAGPQFIVFTGDNVYYDNEEPRAVSVELARYHWQRMYSLTRHVGLLRSVASYWEKDDHDILDDDCWPGQKMGELTFADGRRIFGQQAPVDEPAYRTFRWGGDLQIWLTEGRDHRSPNNLPDGPDKTIWGPEQKEWLKRTLRASDATWRLLISPTPIVGPDRVKKNDNHANEGFRHEGHEMRAWFRDNLGTNFFIICGDRHWQYHSVHPKTGVQEFSCGPASDLHAGGTPGEDPEYHRFHRVKGGFLKARVRRQADQGMLAMEFCDVNGKVVYRWETIQSLKRKP